MFKACQHHAGHAGQQMQPQLKGPCPHPNLQLSVPRSLFVPHTCHEPYQAHDSLSWLTSPSSVTGPDDQSRSVWLNMSPLTCQTSSTVRGLRHVCIHGILEGLRSRILASAQDLVYYCRIRPCACCSNLLGQGLAATPHNHHVRELR